MKLTKRLAMVSSFVKNGCIPADIGTDHAYLPSYLVINGTCERAIAADIGKGPLNNAAETVREFGLEDKIKLILSDGLKKIDFSDIDTVILAGMGGDLIKNILSSADMNELRKIHIIAQPQSHSEKVRLFLMENGFEIEREDVCEDSGHIYNCLSAYYSGKTDYPLYYEYYGKLMESDSDLAETLIQNTVSQIAIKYEALINAKKNSVESEKLNDIIKVLNKIIGENRNENQRY